MEASLVYCKRTLQQIAFRFFYSRVDSQDCQIPAQLISALPLVCVPGKRVTHLFSQFHCHGHDQPLSVQLCLFCLFSMYERCRRQLQVLPPRNSALHPNMLQIHTPGSHRRNRTRNKQILLHLPNQNNLFQCYSQHAGIFPTTQTVRRSHLLQR